MVSNNFKDLKQVISVVNQKNNTNANIYNYKINYINSVDKGKEQNCTDEVILFFSFDVVNSSLYKTINYYGWASVLTKLFKKIQNIVKESIADAELWRVLGDEAVFIVRIKNEEEIYEYIDEIFHILNSIVNDLKNGVFFQQLQNFTHMERELMKRQNIISLKGAAWIAVVTNIKDNEEFTGDEEYENISATYDADNNYKIFEFLGNDIDAGFRIAKKTCDRRLVISYELAYLLSKKTDYISKLNIITYRKLRGIWKDKLYPIIWYYDKGKCNNVSFEDSFYYDEIEENELVKEYFQNRKDGNNVLKNDYMYTDIVKAFEKILRDRNLGNKIEKIFKIIGNTPKTEMKYIKLPLLELHCAAVCYDEKSNKVLIAKRASQREMNQGKWEFGCAKARLEENISESIREEYKKDFNIDIELIADSDRNDSTPVPIAIYELKKSNGLHKGIITIGIIKNNINVNEVLKTKKHEEVKFIGEDEINSFNEPAVDDFKQTLKLVFSKIREIKGGGD